MLLKLVKNLFRISKLYNTFTNKRIILRLCQHSKLFKTTRC